MRIDRLVLLIAVGFVAISSIIWITLEDDAVKTEQCICVQEKEETSVEVKFTEHTTPPSKEQEDVKKLKMVFSFGLYGSSPKYINGAIRNAQLIREMFPGWTARFYHDDTVKEEHKKILIHEGAELQRVGDIKGAVAGMFWRFLVADDPTVDVYMIRDSDSRVSPREKAAIEQFLLSGKGFHNMRDHPSHTHYAMSGGMWGGRKRIEGITDKIRSYEAKGVYIADMNFLNEQVWPIISRDILQHDSFSCDRYTGGVPFPLPRIGLEHAGQVFDENDSPRQGDMDLLAKSLPEPELCRSRWD